jgi:hypothetical protein
MPKTKRLCTQVQKKFWGIFFRWSKRTIDLIQIVLHMSGIGGRDARRSFGYLGSDAKTQSVHDHVLLI